MKALILIVLISRPAIKRADGHDSILSSDNAEPCISLDVTHSSETFMSKTRLSDISCVRESTKSEASCSTNEQLTELAQLVQEHYSYPPGANPTGNQ